MEYSKKNFKKININLFFNKIRNNCITLNIRCKLKYVPISVKICKTLFKTFYHMKKNMFDIFFLIIFYNKQYKYIHIFIA